MPGHAAPGEFTLRAFLSGRLDLTRAEAVLGVIDARTPAQLDAALQQLAGGLAGPIVALRDRLLDVLAHLEAGLDFVDEADVDPLGRAALAASLAEAAAEVAALADRLRGRDRPEGHPRVVLVGPPNAGKSRLFNALLGREQALVSPHAGTTRDYLAAPCDCAGLTVELIDTAGDEPATQRDRGPAQDLRSDQVAQADLLLACRSADTDRPAKRPRSRPIAPGSTSGPSATWLRRRGSRDVLADQRRDRRGPRRAPHGDRRGAPRPPGRRRPPRRHRPPAAAPALSAPARPSTAPRKPCSAAAATSSSPSTSARPSTSWARSSAPSSPTTSSTASSAGSASGNEVVLCPSSCR